MGEIEHPADAPDGARGSPEEREREAAYRRGEGRERARAVGGGAPPVEEPPRGAHTGHARASVAARAFAALAENVRDYAIFLMDPTGVITFWGEGARLIKWWTKDQAEGAHLRLLYPAGGSNDGGAEAHLREAAERGEYTGEGQRVRSDGSTFWAGVTLTALWDEDGHLLGLRQGHARPHRAARRRRAAPGGRRRGRERAGRRGGRQRGQERVPGRR
jgi:PAS domain S-box-containing protein